ncbi:MAG: YczE/YyaS/YitT family protein [Mobilitalea sp.]
MKINFTKILFALLGIFFIGVGVAFNAATQLGNDPVAIIYDGVRNVLGLSGSQLGLVSNVVNFSLIALLFFIGRRYVNIGTLIYILPFGLFVNIGTLLYETIFISDSSLIRIATGLIGSLLIYVGVSIFIAMDMGLDPFTGIVMVIRDKLNLDYKKVKIAFDITLVIIGVLLGGKIGIITIFTALTAGPCIQWISGIISSRLLLLKWTKLTM